MENNKNIISLEGFIRFFNNLVHKKNLIIFIGKKGVTVSAFKHNNLVNSIFLKGKAQYDITSYQNFLKKYHNYHIFFLLDTPESELKHEIIPLLQSIIKVNPVDTFIAENYKKEDIIASNIYKIDYKNGEVWETLIASSPYVEPINKLLEYIIHNSYNFRGIYFLSLEFVPIINSLIKNIKAADYSNYLQVFGVITKSSDIKIVVKHNSNIMEEVTIEYPENKSDSYILGTVEQVINDKLLFFKSYIHRLELNVCIVFLADKVMKELFTKLTFQNHKVIALLGKDIINSSKAIEQRFQDNNLIQLFNNHKINLALNKPLKQITTLTLINSIIFKPLILMIIGMVLTLGALKYKTILIHTETDEHNKQYYLLTEESRNIKKQYPDIEYIRRLVDLYHLELVLNIKSPLPFAVLKDLYGIALPNIELTKVKWYIDDNAHIILTDRTINISIDLRLVDNSRTTEQGMEVLNGYVNHIKSIFQDYYITFLIDSENIIQFSKKIIIPAKITISRKVQGEEYVR